MEVVTDRRFGDSVRGEVGAELIKKELNHKKEALDFSALTLNNAVRIIELFAGTKKRRFLCNNCCTGRWVELQPGQVPLMAT